MMNKIQAFFSLIKKNIPELIFLAFSIRLISVGATLGEALALISFVGIYGFLKFLEKSKMEDQQKITAELENLKNAIQSVKMAQGLKKQHESQTTPNKRYF